MIKYKNWIKSFYAILFIFSMVLSLVPAPVQATAPIAAIFDYMNTGGDGSSNATATGNWTYQTFTTGTTAYMPTAILLSLRKVGSPSYVTVSLRETNVAGDKPTGDDLTVATLLDGTTFTTGYNWYKFVPTTIISLEANTTYAIVVSAIYGSDINYIEWQLHMGGSLAGANNGGSLDSGITWTALGDDQMFEVWGYTSLKVLSASVFTNYIATGDWLVVADIDNTYPPYYNDNADPSVYFLVELVDTTTNVVEAAVPCTQWRRSPVGIYINPAQVTGSLTWGGTYEVRLFCTTTGDHQGYSLVAADWRGSDPLYIDQWIRATAAGLQDYYGVAFLTSVLSKGGQLILNSTGGVFFARGVPALAEARPEMFSEAGGATAPHVEKDFVKTYELSRNWRTTMGVPFETLTKSWGAVLGVDTTDTAKVDTFVGIMFLVAYIILLFILGADKIDGWLAIILALPFIGFGLYAGILAMSYIFAIAMLAIAIRLFNWFSP